jgi:peptide/nickel transport system substrate-binding protein
MRVRTLSVGRAACLALLVAACHRSERAPAAEPSLIVAQGSDPGSFNPAITTSGNVHPVTDQIFNGLVGLDADMNPVPELAAAWDVTDGGRTYSFHLRPDVMWHDGHPFSSSDVKFTFEEALLKYHSRTRAALTAVLAGIDAPDAHTIVFRFREPYGPFLQRLDVVEASILPKHLFEERDVLSAPANLSPVGTGPFRFNKYQKGEFVELQRNPRYFRGGLPRLQRLVFRVLPSSMTAVMALERGEVDYVPSVPGPELSRLQSMPGVTVARGTGGSGGSFCQDVLIPNMTRPPFSDRDVRRAFYTALDRRFIVDRVYFDQGVPSTGPISRNLTWAYSSNVTMYPADPARAERLLDDTGYRRKPNGNRFSVTFTHPIASARLGQIVREQLKKVGVDVVLEPLDFNASVEKTFVRKVFDLGYASFCNGADPEIGVRRVYISSNIGPVPFSNGAGYRNPEVDALFDQAATLVDRSARARVYADLQRRLTEDVPYFWIIDSDGARAFRSSFSGFRLWTGAFAETVERTGIP